MTAMKEGGWPQLMQWLEAQQRIWKDWAANAGKGMDQAMAAWQVPTNQVAPWFDQWYRTWRQFSPAGAAPAAPNGTEPPIGPQVYGRLLDATKVYQDLLGFWARVMSPLSQLPLGARLTADHLKQIHDRWIKEYSSMLESMWGQLPNKEAQEAAKSVASASAAATQYSWSQFEPVFKNLENVPMILERIARGERGGMADLSGVFRKNYEATVGRVLKAPSLGFSRETVENINRTLDAYLQYNVSLSEYQALFYATGMRAGEKVMAKLSDFQGKELNAETFREFYRIWWTINEETYHDVFITEEFITLLQDVLSRGLMFRKWFETLTAELLKTLNIPTPADMNEIYKTLYDLRKEVRWQARSIRELEQQLGIETKRPRPEAH